MSRPDRNRFATAGVRPQPRRREPCGAYFVRISFSDAVTRSL